MRSGPIKYMHRYPVAKRLLLGLLVVLGGPSLTFAATVYKTVDANGVVSYSDVQPATSEPVETLEFDGRAPDISETEQQRLEAMRETTDRMVADRQQREQHRAELRKQRAEQAARQPPPNAVYDYPRYRGYTGGYPVYYPYPVRRPGGGWGRPHPVHPIAPVPLRHSVPGRSHGLPGNDYPASLVRKHYSPPVRAAFRK